MSSLKTMLIGCLLAGGFGLALAAPVAGKEPVPRVAKPAEVCSAMSVSKHYTLADADFGWVRDRLNATLDRVSPDPTGNFHKAARHRIPANAAQFGLRLDYARCESVQGPLAGERLFAGSRGPAKDCREAGCEDPLPGWSAPEGSTLALWTCEGNVFREVVYERVNGTWRVKSVREEWVVSCQVGKEPEEEREPRDGKA